MGGNTQIAGSSFATVGQAAVFPSIGSAQDPFGIGQVTSMPPNTGMTSAPINVNQAAYLKYYGYGLTVSQLRIQVAVQSGNIDVGVYAGGGNGVNSFPAYLLSHTGLIACPGVGVATLTLLNPLTLPPGGWFAILSDNATASFACGSSALVDTFPVGAYQLQNVGASLLPNVPNASFVAASRAYWIST